MLKRSTNNPATTHKKAERMVQEKTTLSANLQRTFVYLIAGAPQASPEPTRAYSIDGVYVRREMETMRTQPKQVAKRCDECGVTCVALLLK